VIVATFEAMTAEIGLAYENLSGLSLGWRFLYSPKRTLEESNGFAVLGFNPGGSTFIPPMPSVESGNAWLRSVERWPSSNTQPNFISLVGKVLRSVAPGSTAAFLARSLTSNIAPFRTGQAIELPQPAYDWSLAFWERHFEILAMQRFILAVGNSGGKSPYAALLGLYGRNGWTAEAEENMPCGWGSYVVRVRRLNKRGANVVLVGVPHFSRFETRDPATVATLSQMLVRALS
jgi:hypothetical protein